MSPLALNRIRFKLLIGFTIGILGVTSLTACDTLALPITTGGDTSDTGTDGDSNTGSNPSGDPVADSGGTAADVADTCIRAGSPASATHAEMFQALNNYRVSQGAPKLVYSKNLETAADAHAKDMYDRSFFSHVSPNGDDPLDRAVAAGFCRAIAIGENIAWNQTSVTAAQTGWQNSPGHNANMISTNYRYIGMGYYSSPDGPYYVQVFGNVSN